MHMPLEVQTSQPAGTTGSPGGIWDRPWPASSQTHTNPWTTTPVPMSQSCREARPGEVGWAGHWGLPNTDHSTHHAEKGPCGNASLARSPVPGLYKWTPGMDMAGPTSYPM